MKIGVLGAGFCGLSAAYHLTKQGHEVVLFEKDSAPGGLAIGFEQKEWAWSLERHYHHWFTNDSSILRLAKELGYPVIVKRPTTSVYVDGTIYQLDSPLSVLTFPKLPVLQRLRMAAVLGIIRYNPIWQPLERIRAVDFLPKAMGEQAYKKLWEPLLMSKFGAYATEISLAWFWARIRKRTSCLAYPKGGFLQFAKNLCERIEKQGGNIMYRTEVVKLTSEKKVSVVTKSKTFEFDRVIVTLPSAFFLRIAPQLPKFYRERLLKLKGLGALNLVLRLKKKFLTDGTYWLSICDKDSPVMAIVEHTNFMDKKYYNNEHIVYVGNYLPFTHPYFSMSKDKLLKLYDSFLQKLNRNYREILVDSHLFKTPFAQPIIPTNYSRMMPSFETPMRNVYLANIQQVYPWDRGTNYAMELGEKVANIVGRQL